MHCINLCFTYFLLTYVTGVAVAVIMLAPNSKLFRVVEFLETGWSQTNSVKSIEMSASKKVLKVLTALSCRHSSVTCSVR